MRGRIGAVLATAGLISLAACEVEQTREGELPEIEVEEGQLPEYDIDGPDIEVGRDTVVVPDIDVVPDTNR